MDYPWPEGRRWLRAVMLMDLQGRDSGPDGRSGSISGPADRENFLRLRGTADAVIVGAQTVRAERYKPMIARPDWAEARAAAGQALAPQLVFVTRTLGLPWGDPVFGESFVSPIVATVAGHPAALLSAARRHAIVLECPSAHVEPHWLLDRLEEMGHRRLVCEGGQRLLTSFAEADLVDEWALTLAPSAQGHAYSLLGSHDEGGFHFLRYVRTDS